MAQLTVRKVEEAVVRALRIRAAERGRSAEAEHREILRDALLERPAGRSFKDYLRAMPNVADDADFDRIAGSMRPEDL